MPPIAEARAIVWALINAAKYMISAPTKTMVASTALVTRRASEWLPRRSANSMAGLGELLMLSIPLRSGLDGFFGRIIIPVQPLMLHHIGSNAREQNSKEDQTSDQQIGDPAALQIHVHEI